MLNKLNLQVYSILSIINLGVLYYLVMDKDLLYLSIFPLFLINQASLGYLIDDLIASVNGKMNKLRFSLLTVLKLGSLVAIVYLMKRFEDAVLAMGSTFLIQTIIFGVSLKTGAKKP